MAYQNSINRLQEIVHELQDDKTTLDDLSSLVKEAKGLIDTCKIKLRNVEEEVQKLITEE